MRATVVSSSAVAEELDRGAPAHLVQHTAMHASLATTSKYVHARPNSSSCQYRLKMSAFCRLKMSGSAEGASLSLWPSGLLV